MKISIPDNIGKSLETLKNYCKSHPTCGGCPLWHKYRCILALDPEYYPEVKIDTTYFLVE